MRFTAFEYALLALASVALVAGVVGPMALHLGALFDHLAAMLPR